MGVTYRFGTYSAIENHVASLDDNLGSEHIFAVTKQVGNDFYECGHVMAVKGAYVVEAVTCGGPGYDTNALADDILERTPG